MLRVAAEARHLVRHDLADRDDEVVRGVDEGAVDGKGQRKPEWLPDQVVHFVRRELTDRRHIVAPAVLQQARGIDRVAEHQPRLGRPEWLVRSERGHDVDSLELAVEEPHELRDDFAGARMQPRLIRRHEQHTSRAGADDLSGDVAHDRSQLGLRHAGIRSGGSRHVRRIGRPRPARGASGWTA